MLDSLALRAIAPTLERGAAALARRGVSADAMTLTGLGLGLAAAVCIAIAMPLLGLALLIASRVADGLDGAIARCGTPTDRGAFLDSACDFLFYAAIPLAFALLAPAHNALPAACLLASFIGTGTSFLAFALIAERRGLTSTRLPQKGFYYLGGLTEGSETIAAFVLMCLRPDWFAVLAYGFAALCTLTAVMRLIAGWRAFAR